MIPRIFLLGNTMLFCLLVSRPALVWAQVDESENDRSDEWVISRLLDSQHVPQATLDVCERASKLAGESKCAFLKQWVLPSKMHRDFRVNIDFDLDGEIISPVTDLIRATHEHGNLDSLILTLESFKTIDPVQDLARMAILAVAKIELESFDDASLIVEAWFAKVLADDALLHRCKDAALLLLARTQDSLQMAKVSIGPSTYLATKYRGVIDRDAWHQHLMAVNARLHDMTIATLGKKDEANEIEKRQIEKQWTIIARPRSIERGLGYPKVNWHFKRGSAEKRSSHSHDFLFFRSPLQGQYAIEANLDGFGYRDTQLVAASHWVSLIYDHGRILRGSVRGETETIDLDPRMTETFKYKFIRNRVSVSPTESKTYLNGRHVHTHAIVGEQNPWVGIRNSNRHAGEASDVRISGNPTIPDTISLSDCKGLPGWYEFHRVSEDSELIDWRQDIIVTKEQDLPLNVANASSERFAGEVIGPIDSKLPLGSNAESLLVYARPAIERGKIEYEFWYSSDQHCVHPAIGNQTMLLSPEGVSIHRVTNGIYERSKMRPDNIHHPVNRKPVLLKENGWNQVSISIEGNKVALSVNQLIVHSFDLPPFNTRQFGLFRYRDREQARVRNVRWTGDWPKTLPSINAQVLAMVQPELRTEPNHSFAQEITYNFNEKTFLSGKFKVTTGTPGRDSLATDQGVIVRRDSEKSYRNAKISPNISLGGDFDITVSYDQFVSTASEDRYGSIMLQVSANSAEQDTGMIQKKHTPGTETLFQCLSMQTVEGSERRHYFNHRISESDWGRMRLSRRGNKLFYQFAENDSDQFRVIGESDYSPDDIDTNGIRMGVQIYGTSGYTSVRYRNLHIRAERINGELFEDFEAKRVQLNRQRESLPDHWTHDFASTPLEDGAFYRWGDQTPWRRSDDGLTMRCRGTDNWTSIGMTIKKPFFGDFDATINFDPKKLALPKASKASGVYLQFDLDDDQTIQFNAQLTRTAEDHWTAEAESNIRTGSGEFSFKSYGVIEAEGYNRLRLARRNDHLYFVAGKQIDGKKGRPSEVLIAQVKFSGQSRRGAVVKVMLHTGGSGRTSDVLLKNIDLRAQRIVGIEPERNALPQLPITPTRTRNLVNPRSGQKMAPKQHHRDKTLVEKFFDLFE